MSETRHGPKSFKDGIVECYCGWTADARAEIIAKAVLTGHIQHALDEKRGPK